MKDDFINYLQSKGVALNPRVAAAFRAIDRADFMVSGDPEVDIPYPIGANQTISQPFVVAFMLDKLDLRPGMSILDVGSGSGWTTALLAHITGEEGCVVGVELVDELVDFGRNNLEKYEFEQASIIKAQEGVYGAPGKGPFDRILVSASANEEAVRSLLKQLKPDEGILVIPLNGRIDKIAKEHRESWSGFEFVPLKSGS